MRRRRFRILVWLGWAGLSAARLCAQEAPYSLNPYAESAWLLSAWAGDAIGQQRLTSMTPALPDDLHRADLAPWDRFAAGWYNPAAATASDVLVVAVAGADVYAAMWGAATGVAGWPAAGEDAVMLAETLSWDAALNLNVRALRLHPRPMVYGSNAPASEREAPQAAGSFYSGHASAAFAGAVFLATVYPQRHPEFHHRTALWAGALGAAALVAGLRVAAGKHFPSDVIAGAAAGSFMGWAFPLLHRSGENSEGLRLWPIPDGAAVQWVYAFSRHSSAGAPKAMSAASTSSGLEKK